MKSDKVNPSVTLADPSDDWTSCSTFVTFMGPLLGGVHRVDESDNRPSNMRPFQ